VFISVFFFWQYSWDILSWIIWFPKISKKKTHTHTHTHTHTNTHWFIEYLPRWSFWNSIMDETIINTWMDGGAHGCWMTSIIYEWMNEWMESVNLVTYNNSFWIEFPTHAILAQVVRELHIHASNLHWTENWCACMHAWMNEWMNELCVTITSWWYDLDVMYYIYI
jgi:hypothetical protein